MITPQLILKIIKLFSRVYKKYDCLFDVEQTCVDAVLGAAKRFKGDDHVKFFWFAKKRTEHHIKNGLIRWKKQRALASKIPTSESEHDQSVEVALALEEIASKVKYGEDVIDVVMGFSTLTEVSRKHNVSVNSIRFHVNRAKNILQKHLCLNQSKYKNV